MSAEDFMLGQYDSLMVDTIMVQFLESLNGDTIFVLSVIKFSFLTADTIKSTGTAIIFPDSGIFQSYLLADTLVSDSIRVTVLTADSLISDTLTITTGADIALLTIGGTNIIDIISDSSTAVRNAFRDTTALILSDSLVIVVAELTDSLSNYLPIFTFADSTQDNSHIYTVLQTFLANLVHTGGVASLIDGGAVFDESDSSFIFTGGGTFNDSTLVIDDDHNRSFIGIGTNAITQILDAAVTSGTVVNIKNTTTATDLVYQGTVVNFDLIDLNNPANDRWLRKNLESGMYTWGSLVDNAGAWNTQYIMQIDYSNGHISFGKAVPGDRGFEVFWSAEFDSTITADSVYTPSLKTKNAEADTLAVATTVTSDSANFTTGANTTLLTLDGANIVEVISDTAVSVRESARDSIALAFSDSLVIVLQELADSLAKQASLANINLFTGKYNTFDSTSTIASHTENAGIDTAEITIAEIDSLFIVNGMEIDSTKLPLGQIGFKNIGNLASKFAEYWNTAVVTDSLKAQASLAGINAFSAHQTFSAGATVDTDSLRISTPNVAGMHKTAIQISSADFGNAAGNEIGIQWMNNNFTYPVLSEISSWSDQAGRWGLRHYTYSGSQNLAVQINGDGNMTKMYNDTTYGNIVGLNNLEMAGTGLFGKSVFINGDTLYIVDASGQDTVRIYDDGDTTRIESDNPIKVGEGSIIVAGDTVVIDKNLKIQEGGSIRGITSEVNGLICNTMDDSQDDITITTIDSSGIGLVRVHWDDFTASINGVIFFIGNDSISVNTGDVLNATNYYVYLNSIGRVVSTTVNPNGSPHVRIADIRIRSSAGVAEVLGWRPGTPHTTEVIYEIYDWVTSQPPVLVDNGLATRFVAATGRIDIELGTVFKAMHKVDLVDTGLDSVMIRVSNDTLVNDLAEITKYYDGTTIGANKYFSVFIGRVVQDTSMVAKIAIAVQDRPSTEYVSAAQAIDDVDMVKIAVFPGIYKGSVVPVAYAIMKKGDPSTIQIIDERH